MRENKSDEKSNVKAIILTGLVSLIVGVGSGWIINVLTEKQAKLTYDITTQEVFSGSSNNIGIFGIRISNTGKKEIEDVSSQLDPIHKGKNGENSLIFAPNEIENEP